MSKPKDSLVKSKITKSVNNSNNMKNLPIHKDISSFFPENYLKLNRTIEKVVLASKDYREIEEDKSKKEDKEKQLIEEENEKIKLNGIITKVVLASKSFRLPKEEGAEESKPKEENTMLMEEGTTIVTNNKNQDLQKHLLLNANNPVKSSSEYVLKVTSHTPVSNNPQIKNNPTSSESPFHILDSLTHSSFVKEEKENLNSKSTSGKNNTREKNIIYSIRCKIHSEKNLKVLDKKVICLVCGNSLFLEEFKQKPKEKPKRTTCDFDLKEAVFFCASCDRFLCKSCFARNHKSHKSNLISEMAPEIQNESTLRIKKLSQLREKLLTTMQTTSKDFNKINISKVSNSKVIKKGIDSISKEYKKYFDKLEGNFNTSLLDNMEIQDLRTPSSKDNTRITLDEFQSNSNQTSTDSTSSSSFLQTFNKYSSKLNSITEFISIIKTLQENLKIKSMEDIKQTHSELVLLIKEVEKFSIYLNNEDSKSNNNKNDVDLKEMLKLNDKTSLEMANNFTKNKQTIDNLIKYFKYLIDSFYKSANYFFSNPVSPYTFFIRRFDSFSNEDIVRFFKRTSISVTSKDTIYIKGISLCGLKVNERERLRIVSGELNPEKLQRAIQIEVKEVIKCFNGKNSSNNKDINNITNIDSLQSSVSRDSMNTMNTNSYDARSIMNDVVNNNNNTPEKGFNHGGDTKYIESIMVTQQAHIKPILNSINPVFSVMFQKPVECCGLEKDKNRHIVITVTNLSDEYVKMHTGNVPKSQSENNIQIIFYEVNLEKEQEFFNFKQDFRRLNPFICFTSKNESDFVETEKGIISDIIYSRA